MGRWVTRDEYGDLFAFEQTAFRLEVQPYYNVPYERESVESFLAGQPVPPSEVPELAQWFSYVQEQTEAGRIIERVRVQPDPPTDYQRWERWVGHWNAGVGERIGYITPERASMAGIPIDRDWWLFDSSRVLMMEFDDDLLLSGGYLLTKPDEVAKFCAWRDLAVHNSAPDSGAATT